jgi:hypothetical protein
VRDVGVGVAAADPALGLKNFRDGVVELPSFGVPVFDDVQGVRVRRKSVVGWLELGVERVGDFTRSPGVGRVIRENRRPTSTNRPAGPRHSGPSVAG